MNQAEQNMTSITFVMISYHNNGGARIDVPEVVAEGTQGDESSRQ